MISWQPHELNLALRPIAEHIGVDAAQALVREFGGARLHVPKVWRDGHLLNALGEDMARRLIAEFAGEVITVPRTLATQAARIGRAQAMRAEGATVNEIARALGLSHRGAQEHIAGTAKPVQRARRRMIDDRQIDLEELIAAAKR